MYPLKTIEVILYFIENLHLYNVSIHRIFYQNWFLNKYARMKKAKITESQSPGVMESRSHRVSSWDIEELTFLKKWWNGLIYPQLTTTFQCFHSWLHTWPFHLFLYSPALLFIPFLFWSFLNQFSPQSKRTKQVQKIRKYSTNFLV